MVEGLRLALLGGLHLSRSGAPVAGFVSSKVPALLCYLAVTGCPHSRAELAGLLWGEMPDATANANLRQALANLRRSLAAYLLITPRTVEFDRRQPYWLDVEILQRQVDRYARDGGRGALSLKGLGVEGRALAQGPPRAGPDCDGLHEAVELYRGEFLQGFQVRAAPAFEEWVLGQREQWRQTALQALDALTVHAATENRLEVAIGYATRRLALDPWQEQAHRQLMELLARAGQREAALAQFETCRRRLAQDLGVEPMAETTALYERLRAMGQARPHNLPAPTTSFVGREAELTRLFRTLAEPACRQVTILGPGGAGKTRLAVQAALQLCAEPGPAFRDGLYVVSLASIISAETLITEIVHAMGIALQPGAPPKLHLLNHLRGKELLLILDGFEHLVAQAGVLAEILQAAPQVRLWVTSRQRLNLQGEWLLHLGGLSYPTVALDAKRPETFPAAQLFIQRAWQVRPEFAPARSDVDSQAIARICQLVDGLPLGLELAAGWLQTLSCAEIASEIERSQDVPSLRQADRPARHQSLHAVLDHSWQLLSDVEQRVLQRLAVFCGGFTREAASQVAGADLPQLSALVDKSLLRVSSAGRYDFHLLVQHYAAKKLAQRPSEQEQARLLHSRYFAGLVQRCGVQLLGPDQEVALAEMDRDIDNVRAFWRWAAAGRRLEELGQSVRGLGVYRYLRGLLAEGNEAMQQIATAFEDLEGASSDANLAALLGGALMFRGMYGVLLGEYEVSARILAKSLTHLGLAQATWERVMALTWLGIATASQGQYLPGRRYVEEGLVLARAIGDPWLKGMALACLGLCVRWRDYAEAAAYFRDASEAFREAGDWRQMAAPLLYLGETLRLTGRLAEARRQIEDSLTFAREHHIGQLEAWALWNLGEIVYALGAYPEAQQHFQVGFAVAQEVGDNQMLLACEAGWASAALRLGDLVQAQHHFHLAFRHAVETQAWPHIIDLLIRRAEMLAGREQAGQERAVEWLTVAVGHPAVTQESRVSAEAMLHRLRGSLPPELSAAAQTRAHGRSVEGLVDEIQRMGIFSDGLSGSR